MGILALLTFGLVAPLITFSWIIRDVLWFVCARSQSPSWLEFDSRVSTRRAPAFQALPGMGAKPARLFMTKRIRPRSARQPHDCCAGHWTLALHGPDSLTPLTLRH